MIFSQILVVINSLILPIFYTIIKQKLYQSQQYGKDLISMLGDSYDNAVKKTGIFYQNNNILLVYLCIVFIIILAQFIYLQYIINNGFRFDKIWLLFGAILCIILALCLPILLCFSYFYDPNYIGNLLLQNVADNPISDFLKINFTSIISWFSGLYILSNIIYLFLFNKVHYICISKVI